jgi:hypothetical protein
MSAYSDTPSLVASGDCTAYRFVRVSGRNQGITCDAITNIAVGVADGSSKSFPATGVTNLHAAAGDPINLQGGNVVLVEAAAAITAGARVAPSANGRAQTAVGTQFPFGIALENAGGASEIIRVYKMHAVATA